jgi:GntR family transcriptional regulator/MocR family aminotransferase
MRASVLSDWLAQRLDRGNGQPIYRQLHRLLQQAILSRELPAGTKVPSSRLLANELGIARNTVTQVYEQLALEGYVTSTTGRGTFVADSAPDEIVGAPDAGPAAATPQPLSARRALSTRGARLIAGAGVSKRQWGAFMPGVPDVSKFPARVWSRLHTKYWRRLRPDLLTYAPGGGLALLRHALADYLRTSRSVRCTPEQIIITTGIHQSVDLAVRLLSDPGDVIWTEDPCYWGVRSVLHVSGLQSRPIAVDAEGINPSAEDLAQPPKLMLVTPSHQYPLGMVMSLARRRMLLEYARQHQCWIIEDDYDSEFRYGSRPLASLQGLDTAGQVIYVGSFGKTLFPGLRIGYIVVPEALAESFATASAELYREGQLLQQAVLAEFIAEGHFASHIRKMRTLYGQRRQTVLDAAARRYGDALPAVGGDAGLHLVMQLPEGADDRAVAAAALERNIVVRALSGYYAQPQRAPSGLLIGYACVPDEEIAPAFNTLADAIDATLLQFA